MADVVTLPAAGVFLDARGEGRALRATWHSEQDLVVLSLWRGGACVGTFRLSDDDAAQLAEVLVEGLARARPERAQLQST